MITSKIKRALPLLGVLFLTFFYQNCTPVKFNITGGTSSKFGGDVFDGKPESYYNVVPGFTCAGLESYQSKIDFRNGDYFLTTNFSSQCAAINNKALSKSEISRSSYNPDFIGYQKMFFNKSDVVPTGKDPFIYEAWCQPDDPLASDLVDVVITYNEVSKSTQARMYYKPTNAVSALVPDFNVTRNMTSAQAQYTASDFSLTIDKSKPASLAWWYYSASLTSTKANLSGSKNLICRTAATSRFLTVDPTENPMLANADLTSQTCATINGKCSVRAAFQAASNINVPVVIHFLNGSYNITNQLVTPVGEISLIGQSRMGVLIDGTGTTNGIFASGSSSLNFSQMTIQGGNNTTSSFAGGISIVNGAQAVISDVTLQNNNSSGNGGAIYSNLNRLALSDVLCKGNSTSLGGGCLYAHTVDLSIQGSTFDNNAPTGLGLNGAAFTVFNSPRFQFLNSTVKNTSVLGSNDSVAEVMNSADVVIQNSTFNNNFGGVALVISEPQNDVTVLNTTIANNSRLGLSFSNTGSFGNGNLNINHLTLVENGNTGGLSVGYLTNIKNSIISQSSGPACVGQVAQIQASYSLFSDNTCAGGIGVLQGVTPLLGALSRNGGPTLTMEPLGPANPAIDAADNSSCPVTDQRGYVRPINKYGVSATCDIGAVESQLFVTAADCSSGVTASSGYTSGSGFSFDPYLICNLTQWNKLAATSTDWNKSFKLGADIDFSGVTASYLQTIGTATNPFVGAFDGDGFWLKNLSVDGGVAPVGLFAYAGSSSFTNLKIKDVAVSSSALTSVLVQKSSGKMTFSNVTLQNISSTSTATLKGILVGDGMTDSGSINLSNVVGTGISGMGVVGSIGGPLVSDIQISDINLTGVTGSMPIISSEIRGGMDINRLNVTGSNLLSATLFSYIVRYFPSTISNVRVNLSYLPNSISAAGLAGSTSEGAPIGSLALKRISVNMLVPSDGSFSSGLINFISNGGYFAPVTVDEVFTRGTINASSANGFFLSTAVPITIRDSGSTMDLTSTFGGASGIRHQLVGGGTTTLRTYFAGTVSGANALGCFGSMYTPWFGGGDNYYDGTKCPINPQCETCNNRNTSQMQSSTPFPNWNNGLWIFSAGSYPRLSWESN